MNRWLFNALAALLALPAASGVAAQAFPADSAAPRQPERVEAEAAPAPNPTRRPLDRREHRGYAGWERLIPTHVKVQYAGGMGFLSAGIGWDYGRRCRWETDLMAGILPGAWSDRTHTCFTLRQNYIPWSIRCGNRLSCEPFACGLYLTLISGERFWMREPDRYPIRRYYGFSSRLRLHLFAGQRLTWHLRGRSALRSVALYWEWSANDLDLTAWCGNRTLSLADICYFSLGIRLHVLR